MIAGFSIPLLIILLILAIISFFFSLSETSIIGLSKLRLRHMLAKGVKNSQSIHRLISMSDKFIIGILAGNNFINIAFSTIVSVILVHLFGERWGVVLATLAAASFILIFCEILPKMLALKNTEKMALFVAPIMELYIKMISPIIKGFSKITDLILHILRIKHPKRSPLITEEELRLMIEIGKEEGVLTEEEKKMLQRIFEFGDIKVEDVMVPTEHVVSVSADVSSNELLDIFAEQGHARLPVYKDKNDNIVGLIFARDLLYILKDPGLFLLPDLIHNAYFVPLNMRVSELLRKFQTEKMQMAIVVDDNKKMKGVVTLEDLLEEIVGEIEEKYSHKDI